MFLIQDPLFATSTDSLETDRAQLLVLYNAAGGPAWVRNIGWITNHPDIGDLWAWVRTRDDRVVALKLTGNNLKGKNVERKLFDRDSSLSPLRSKCPDVGYGVVLELYHEA